MKHEHCPSCGEILSDPADQSSPMRRRFFAIIRDAHNNMPDHLRPLAGSSEHLRKLILIKIGYCDQIDMLCSSNPEALRAAVSVKQLDTYVITTVDGRMLHIYRAKSLQARVCNKKQFMEIADKAYAELNTLLGYDVEQSEIGRDAA